MSVNLKPNFKLKGARAEKGFSQEDMAKALGISRVSYGQKENGISEFTEVEMKKSCQALEKEVTDIFFNS